MHTDSGSATVWWVALSTLLWFATLAAVLAAMARLDRDSATTAADLAALAGAAQAVHGAERACTEARVTAEANEASLESCDLSGRTVEVVVSVPSSVLDRTVDAQARAEPVHEAVTSEEAE